MPLEMNGLNFCLQVTALRKLLPQLFSFLVNNVAIMLKIKSISVFPLEDRLILISMIDY